MGSAACSVLRRWPCRYRSGRVCLTGRLELERICGYEQSREQSGPYTAYSSQLAVVRSSMEHVGMEGGMHSALPANTGWTSRSMSFMHSYCGRRWHTAVHIMIHAVVVGGESHEAPVPDLIPHLHTPYCTVRGLGECPWRAVRTVYRLIPSLCSPSPLPSPSPLIPSPLRQLVAQLHIRVIPVYVLEAGSRLLTDMHPPLTVHILSRRHPRPLSIPPHPPIPPTHPPPGGDKWTWTIECRASQTARQNPDIS